MISPPAMALFMALYMRTSGPYIYTRAHAPCAALKRAQTQKADGYKHDNTVSSILLFFATLALCVLGRPMCALASVRDKRTHKMQSQRSHRIIYLGQCPNYTRSMLSTPSFIEQESLMGRFPVTRDETHVAWCWWWRLTRLIGVQHIGTRDTVGDYALVSSSQSRNGCSP